MSGQRICECCGKPLNRSWQVKYCSLQCTGISRRNGEVEYRFSQDGKTGYGKLMSGDVFIFDSDDFEKICNTMWYGVTNGAHGEIYVEDSRSSRLHRIILNPPPNSTVDHINLDTLDNRKCNLRICTHRENLCNRGCQTNNTSGVPGVQWQKRRGTWNAGIKHYGQNVHLGAYRSFTEAVQARNEGMRWLFGEFGRYTDVPEAPEHIKEYVRNKCIRYLKDTAVYFCPKKVIADV